MLNNNPQFLISKLMSEDFDFSASVPDNSQQIEPIDLNGCDGYDDCDDCDDEYSNQDDEYTTEELKISKRFVELLGGFDRARIALDKIEECDDCIDLLDDENDEITQIAAIMPSSVDLPTSPTAATNLASMYDPNSTD